MGGNFLGFLFLLLLRDCHGKSSREFDVVHFLVLSRCLMILFLLELDVLVLVVVLIRFMFIGGVGDGSLCLLFDDDYSLDRIPQVCCVPSGS